MLYINKHRIRGHAVQLDAMAFLLVDVPLSPPRIGGAPIQILIGFCVLQPVPRTGGKTLVLDDRPVVRER